MYNVAFIEDFFRVHAEKFAVSADGCWRWTAARYGFGYGVVSIRDGDRRYNVGAHRAAYEAWNGPGSAIGSMVLHRCHNPACINPAHLELGDHAKNMRQMVDAGHSQKGVKNAFAVFDEKQVSLIRQLLRDGATLTSVARRFGVFHQTIKHIAVGSTWSHLPGAIPASKIRYGKGARRLLNDAKVSGIRRRIAEGLPAHVVAREYGVSASTVYAIKHNRMWAGRGIAA